MSGRSGHSGARLEDALVFWVVANALVDSLERPLALDAHVQRHAQRPAHGKPVEADVLVVRDDESWCWYEAKRNQSLADVLPDIAKAHAAFEDRSRSHGDHIGDRFVLAVTDEGRHREGWERLRRDLERIQRGESSNSKEIERIRESLGVNATDFLHTLRVEFVRLSDDAIRKHIEDSGLLAPGVDPSRLRSRVLDAFEPSSSEFPNVSLRQLADTLRREGILDHSDRPLREAVRWLIRQDSRDADGAGGDEHRIQGLARRELLGQLREAAETNHIVVVGPMGAGKSHLLRRFTRDLGDKALFLEAAVLATRDAEPLRFPSHPRGARATFELWARRVGPNAVLVVDGFDEVAGTERRDHVVELLRAAQATPGVRLVVGSRRAKGVLGPLFPHETVHVPELSAEEIRSALITSGIAQERVEALPPTLIDLLANPFRMELFLAGGAAAELTVTSASLMCGFVESRLAGTVDAEHEAKSLAKRTIGGERLLDVAPTPARRVLVDAGILRERRGCFEFRHQAFRDHFLGRHFASPGRDGEWIAWLAQDPDALDRESVLWEAVGYARWSERRSTENEGWLRDLWFALLRAPLPENLRVALCEAFARELDEDTARALPAWLDDLEEELRKGVLRALLASLQRFQAEGRSRPVADATFLAGILRREALPPLRPTLECLRLAVVGGRGGGEPAHTLNVDQRHVREILAQPLRDFVTRLESAGESPEAAASLRGSRASACELALRCVASIDPAGAREWFASIRDVDPWMADRLYVSLQDPAIRATELAIDVWERSVAVLAAMQRPLHFQADRHALRGLLVADPRATTLAALRILIAGTQRRLAAYEQQTNRLLEEIAALGYDVRTGDRAAPSLSPGDLGLIADRSHVHRELFAPDQVDLDVFDTVLDLALRDEGLGADTVSIVLRAIRLRGVFAYPRAKILERTAALLRDAKGAPAALVRHAIVLLGRVEWVREPDLRLAADDALMAMEAHPRWRRIAAQLRKRWERADMPAPEDGPDTVVRSGGPRAWDDERLREVIDERSGIRLDSALRRRTLAARSVIDRLQARGKWTDDAETALLELDDAVAGPELSEEPMLRVTLALALARGSRFAVTAEDAPPEVVARARRILVRLASDPDPELDEVTPNAVRTYGQSVRALSAEGLLEVAAAGPLDLSEQDAVRALSGDRVSSVRFAVARGSTALLKHHAELAWAIAQERARGEQGEMGAVVLDGYVCALGSHPWDVAEPASLLSLLETILGRHADFESSTIGRDVLRHAIERCIAWSVWSDDDRVRKTAVGVVEHVDPRINGWCASAIARVAEGAWASKNAKAPQARERAFDLWTAIVRSARARLETPGGRELARTVIRECALWICRETETPTAAIGSPLVSRAFDPLLHVPWDELGALVDGGGGAALDVEACRTALAAARKLASTAPSRALLFARAIAAASADERVADWLTTSAYATEELIQVLRAASPSSGPAPPEVLAILRRLRPLGSPAVSRFIERLVGR